MLVQDEMKKAVVLVVVGGSERIDDNIAYGRFGKLEMYYEIKNYLYTLVQNIHSIGIGITNLNFMKNSIHDREKRNADNTGNIDPKILLLRRIK